MYHRHRLPTDTTVRQLAEAWLSYIESQVRQGHGAHPHDMRHGWVFTALAGGVSLEHTSEGVGHRSQGTTRRIYGAGVNLTPGMLGAAEAVERIKAEAVKALREPS